MKVPRTAVCFLTLYACFLFACQPSAAPSPLPAAPAPLTAAPAAAAPAAPSETVSASPALSVLPTSAITPAPAEPTPDPNLGVGDIIYSDALDGSSGFGWTYESETVTFSIGGGQLNAVMKQGNVGPRLRGGPEVTLGDQQLRVTARAHLCYARDEYGLLFRGQRDALGSLSAYVFKVSCGGEARVEVLRGGESAPVVDWTPAAALVSGAPSENTLMVWMVGDQFHFYVNERYLFSARDATFRAGLPGIYIRDRTNGGEAVSFLDLVARAVKQP